MLTGIMPFHALRDPEISYRVVLGERPEIPTNARELGISDKLRQLLIRCWHAKSTQRPLIKEIVEHLSNDPARRLIFPPSKFPQAPSYESVVSGTQKYCNYLRPEDVLAYLLVYR